MGALEMNLWATSTFQKRPHEEQPTEQPTQEPTEREATRRGQRPERERQEQEGAPVAAVVMWFFLSLVFIHLKGLENGK